jgi:hypothetical protein
MSYDEIDLMPLTDVLSRYEALNDRDSMARAIATQKARGTWKGDGSIRAEDYPLLTVDEHLELVALGERLAHYYRHPALVHHAVTAGATWEQIAAATGGSVSQARQAYVNWAVGQRRLWQAGKCSRSRSRVRSRATAGADTRIDRQRSQASFQRRPHVRAPESDAS